MSSQEMLEKAIKKAIDGGWKAYYGGKGIGWADVEAVISYYKLANDDWYEQEEDGYEHFIFNHDFAKALWGTNGHYTPDVFNSTVCTNCHQEGAATYADEDWAEPCYQHHLKQMVTADDPIKYLEQNI